MVSTDTWSAPRVAGRPLRVLHIGNIANNAYINARMMNRAGLDCDVIVHNYFHIMGCPEWEDADFTGDLGDHFHPRWHAVDLKGFERPRWFASGPIEWSLRYLLARRRGQRRRAEVLWRYLEATRRVDATCRSDRMRERSVRLAEHLRSVVIHGTGRLQRPLHPESPLPRARAAELGRLFAERFPERADALTHYDLYDCLQSFDLWQQLFRHYDIVQGYADRAIFPLLYHEGPYTAFEHGTLRDLPWEDSRYGRHVALSFGAADHVFVTNADCVGNAERLAPGRHTFLNHPYDELQSGRVSGWRELRARLLGDGEALLFHPARHDWIEGKGYNDKANDRFLRAFARLVRGGRRLKLVCTAWGNNVAESKQLIAELGVAHAVDWIEPVGNFQFERLILASDFVVDQFVLGAFGGVTYKSLAAGRPVVVFLDEAQLTRLYGEPPPVVNCRTEDEIHARVHALLDDPEGRRRLGDQALSWIRAHHAGRQTIRTQVEVYQRLLRERAPGLRKPRAEVPRIGSDASAS